MKSLSIFILFCAGGASTLMAQSEGAGNEAKWFVSQETAVVSQYLWRGFLLNESATLQPSITVGHGGLSVNVWESFSHHPLHHQAWSEHDITADYTFTRGRFKPSVGYTYYRFPDLMPEEGNHSSEVYVGLAYEHWLQPSVKVYRDVDLGHGTYYFASVGRTLALSDRLHVVTSLGVGVNQHQYQPITTVSDVDGNMALAIRATNHIEITPMFQQMVGHRSVFGNHRAFGVKLTATK